MNKRNAYYGMKKMKQLRQELQKSQRMVLVLELETPTGLVAWGYVERQARQEQRQLIYRSMAKD
jgi:hypothetical protein